MALRARGLCTCLNLVFSLFVLLLCERPLRPGMKRMYRSPAAQYKRNSTNKAEFRSFSCLQPQLREQEFQVFPAQVPNHAIVGADNGRGQIPLVLLQFEDLLLDSV